MTETLTSNEAPQRGSRLRMDRCPQAQKAPVVARLHKARAARRHREGGETERGVDARSDGVSQGLRLRCVD